MNRKNKLMALLTVATMGVQTVVTPMPINVFADTTGIRSEILSISVEEKTANFSFDLTFDDTETLERVQSRNIVAVIYDSEGLLVETIDFASEKSVSSTYNVDVEKYFRGNAGEVNPKTGEKLLADSLYAYRVSMENLPQDVYTLTITGDNYSTFEEEIDLNITSKHITIGATNGGFMYGDFDKSDGSVSYLDIDAITNAIGTENLEFDVNNDGKVDILDIIVAKTNQDYKTKTTIIETGHIDNTSILYEASDDVVSLLVGETMSLSPEEGETEASFEIPFAGDTMEELPELSQISFSTTATNLEVTVETVELVKLEVPVEDGSDETVVVYVEQTVETTYDSYDLKIASIPSTYSAISFSGVSAVSAISTINTYDATNTVTIDLGTRVAVKKITVTVTLDSSDEYVEVKEVTFLQDVVPEDPYKNDGIVTLYSDDVKAGDKSLSLTWDAVPNVAGYIVSWGESSGKYTQSMQVSSTSASISGLENLTPYYIVVKSISGDWSSVNSNEVIGIPQPSTIPGVPRDVAITEEDEGATFAWKDALNGETYNIYLRKYDESQATLIATGLTSFTYTVRGLENMSPYYVSISSSNKLGEGSKTAEYEFTPEPYPVDGPTLPEYNRIPNDKIKSITMGQSDYDKTWSTPNFTADYMIDGNYATSWVPTNYGNTGGFIIEFTEAVSLDYVVVVEKLDRNGAYVGLTGNYQIKVWNADGTTETLVYMRTTGVSRYTAENDIGYMVLPFAQRDEIVKIQIATRIYDGAGSVGVQSMSEIALYYSDDLEERIDALYEDVLQTKLVESVTQEDIDAIREELEGVSSYVTKLSSIEDDLVKAERLLKDDDSMIGYIKTDVLNTGSTYLPLGVTSLAKFDLRVFVEGLEEGETLQFGYSQFYDETGSAMYESAVTVKNGENYLTVPQLTNLSGITKGGPMYYKYDGNSDVKIHFYRMVGLSNTVDYTSKIIAIPTLELYDIDDISANEELVKARMTDYIKALDYHQDMSYSKLEVNDTKLSYQFASYVNITSSNKTTSPVNATEISYNSVLHSIPATAAYEGLGSGTVEQRVEKLYESALAWEELLSLLNYAYGISETETASRQHSKYMRQTASSAAYAAGTHIGIGYDWAKSVMGGTASYSETGNAVNLFGWGFAHEFGHNMDRIGDVEASNNLYSQLSVTWDGELGLNTSSSRVPWSDVFSSVSMENSLMPSNVFTKLGMYWQLHLAYSIDGPNDTSNALDFYNAMNATMRKGVSLPVAASVAAGKNLENFFDAWGYSLTSADRLAMSLQPTETRNIEYLNDDSRTYRINGGEGLANVSGIEFSVTAVQDSQVEDNDDVSGKIITLTISDNIDYTEIVGYKISRDGKGIGFVTADKEGDLTFVDVISSINNVSFEYQVQPIDMLGNFVGKEAVSESVRIEYNDVISKDSFDVEPIENGYKFTVNTGRTVAVSGILIDNAPSSGEFVVSVGQETETTEETYEEISIITTDTGTYEIVTDTISAYEVESDSETTRKVSGISIVTEMVYSIVREGDFSVNHSDKNEYLNYFNKVGVASTDTRIAVYDANEIIITGIDTTLISADDIQFIQYVGDSVSFTDYKMGVLAHDFDMGDGEVLYAGDVIVVGNYIGDVYFNEIYLEGKYVNSSSIASDSTDFAEVSYVQRAISGDTYMFASVPENGVVSTISDGLFIFKMNVAAEECLIDNHASCSVLSLYPSQFRAVMLLNDSTGASRVTSYTSWEYTPAVEEMPNIQIG